MTTMNRLYEKDLLDRRIERGKGGLYYVYWAKLDEENFKKPAVREVISSLLSNFSGIVTNSLIEEAASNEEEVKDLRDKLEDIMKEKRR
jgi:predicted transcriptional regulator